MDHAVTDLPLFAAASGRAEAPFWFGALEPVPPSGLRARPARQAKPPPPSGEAIWPRHTEMLTLPADLICAALRAAKAHKPKRPAPIDSLLLAIQALPGVCRAIGQPELTPDATASIARNGDKLEISYRGPKEHLIDALSAISEAGATLPAMVRCAASQLLPMRAHTAERGVAGWRAIIPVRAKEVAATLAA